MQGVDFISPVLFARLADPEDPLTVESALPADALGHDALADSVCAALAAMAAGKVFAIEGSWGRGKTDLLARVAARTCDPDDDRRPRGLSEPALWVNPWQYGEADLLTPLVAELARRARHTGEMDRAQVKRSVEVLLRAGVAIGLAGAGLVSPVSKAVADAVAQPLDDWIKAMVDGKGDGDSAPLDPVAAMGAEFRTLVEAAVPSEVRAAGGRLLICIDDLDRCLPHRQVALLQAIRFLLSAQASASFLVAIDPRLAREAVHTHYGVENFDVDRYLDKMFDLRVPMRGLGHTELRGLMEAHLATKVELGVREVTVADRLGETLGIKAQQLAGKTAEVLSQSSNANPRVLRRVFDRLLLLLMSRDNRVSVSQEPKSLRAALVALWLLICDRWPAIRRRLQSTGFGEWSLTVAEYSAWAKQHTQQDDNSERGARSIARNVMGRNLPDPLVVPGVVALFRQQTNLRDNASRDKDFLKALDDALLAAGL